ncbi:MFS general substrate transporter [Dothidotthia symphoricarpi CBS 119687]|uniref:MFS general substrate transporter n=1 Tax=Dothidotthia symphoricarpi CBS 119687 TaxID=1392245 RepID=A0A6A6ALJ9_9PLEO|nr:MFS general substrate transporter [Dothidotthia symphoricarpi CBS 119687]KAF2132862.1 MFS general substrate transporter [Dothidotthia symphoricarpi CBS 119687]
MDGELSKEKENELDDMASQEIDLERINADEVLQREISGPPYSAFSSGMKAWIIFLVSVSALISPFGATTVLPALNVLSDVLNITATQTNISITTYMIAQGIAPAIIAGMSDNSGRRLAFIVCFVIYIVGNIGLALQTNYIALLILRMVQAVGCSAAIALAFAVVADLATSAERGKYMGYAGAGILMGPAFGPTIGGILSQYLGWRSVFWFLAIFAGVLLVLFVFLFPETCRNVVGNGSIPAKGINQSVIGYLQQRRLAKDNLSNTTTTELGSSDQKEKRKWPIPNPLATLHIIAEKESGIILFYNGFFFTGMMLVSTSIPYLFHEAYGLNELDVGLCYIANGMGSLLASLTTGHIVDWNFRRYAAALGMTITKGKQQDLSNFPIERVKMEIVIPGHIIGTIGILIFGWTVKFQTHIVGPEIALFIIGFGVSTAFNITNGLLVDLHRDQPAAATAAVNFARCLMSAGGSAAIIPMCKAMNPGWAFTFIALVYVVLIGVVFLIIRDGMRWRQEMEEKKRAKKEEREASVEQAEAEG